MATDSAPGGAHDVVPVGLVPGIDREVADDDVLDQLDEIHGSDVAPGLAVSSYPHAQINYLAVSTSSTWQTLSLRSTDARLQIMAEKTGNTGINPQIVLADQEVFGVPVHDGGNQAGVGILQNAQSVAVQCR